jgi:hypothetical protein
MTALKLLEPFDAVEFLLPQEPLSKTGSTQALTANDRNRGHLKITDGSG